jgi:hypothetical protein
MSRANKLNECTVLPDWPTNEPHPTIDKAWKYIACLDDTIALVNGEKFNPVMMEGNI